MDKSKTYRDFNYTHALNESKQNHAEIQAFKRKYWIVRKVNI